MDDMQAAIVSLGKALKIPESEYYRLTIAYTKLEGWYFVDASGTPSYNYANLKLYYANGAMSFAEFVKMIEKLNT